MVKAQQSSRAGQAARVAGTAAFAGRLSPHVHPSPGAAMYPIDAYTLTAVLPGREVRHLALMARVETHHHLADAHSVLQCALAHLLQTNQDAVKAVSLKAVQDGR